MERLERIAMFASKDKYRTHLNHCKQYKPLKSLVACDGHRLILSKRDFSEDYDSFNASVFLKTGSILKPDKPIHNYPRIESIIPSSEGYSEPFDFLVPEYFKLLAKHRKPIPIIFIAGGIATIGNAESQDNKLFALDARLLAPLAEIKIGLSFHLDESAIRPVKFSCDPEGLSGVIMPMRIT